MTKRSDGELVAEKVSPRGLVRVRVRRYRGAEAEQFFRWEQAGSKGLTLRPNTILMIERYVSTMTRIMQDNLKSDGHNPALYLQIEKRSTADRAYFAADMLKQLSELEGYLAKLKTESSVSSWLAQEAIMTALAFASAHHSWTIVNNENPIHAREMHRKGIKERAASLRPRLQARTAKIIAEYHKRRPHSRNSDSALMEKIGKDHGLGRSQSLELLKIIRPAKGKSDN